MTLLRRLAPLLGLLALTAVLAACGSSDGGPKAASGSATDILKDTFGPGKPVHSGRLNGTLDLDLQGIKSLSGPISLTLTGPFQSQGTKTLPAFDFSLGIDAGGQSFTAGAVSTGKQGFLKFQGATYDVGSALYGAFKDGYEQAVKDSGKRGGPSFATLGIDPLRWLTNPRKAGDADVDGTATTRVTADVNVAKLLEDVNTLLGKAGSLGAGAANLPGQLSQKDRDAIAGSVKTATFDVYAGKDDGILRRLVINLDFAVPASARRSTGGLKGGTARLDLRIDDLNQDQTITAPKGAKPISGLMSGLSGLLGGGGGSGSSSGSGSSGSGSSGSGSSPGSGSRSSAYLSCLDKAGTDIAKVQKCASLLGG